MMSQGDNLRQRRRPLTVKILSVAVLTLLAGVAFAELQQVEIGGEIMIRARWWGRAYAGNLYGPSFSGITPGNAPGRSMGPTAISSRDNIDFVEQRTRIHVKASFTDSVASFVEFESHDQWGDSFRSDYRNGLDTSSDGLANDDIALYQAYIEMNDVYDMPLRLRIGRQEMELGKGWLIDDRVTTTIGLAFDEIRLTYAEGPWEIDAWYGTIGAGTIAEEDDHVTFAGTYGTYKVADPLSVSAYWYWIRDGRSINDTNRLAWGEWLEDWAGVDDYDPTNFHTVGTRFFGEYGQWDYDWELAYQFGNADAAGARFTNNPKFGLPGVYGDDDADYGFWATDLELGYTFESAWTPRVSLGGFYFGGEDNRGVSFLEWLNPFDRPDASIGFNQIFHGEPYLRIFRFSQESGNFWRLYADVEAKPTDAVSVRAEIHYYGIVDPVEWPHSVKLGRYRFPIAPAFSFWTEEASDDLGWAVAFGSKYKYSKDLSFDVRWEHLFQGDGLDEGSFNYPDGFFRGGGSRDDGVDYFHLRATLMF